MSNATNIEALGTRLAEASMTILARTCRAEIAAADASTIESALAAMRARKVGVVDQLMDDIREAPWVAEAAFAAAALSLAQPGIEALRGPTQAAAASCSPSP